MSRSFVRLISGVALAAMLPAIAEAQACPVVGGGSCSVLRNATLTIPKLALIDVTTPGDIALTAPDWNALITAPIPAAVTTETAAALTLRSNTLFGVNLTAGVFSGPVGGMTLANFGYKFSTTASCPAGGFTPLTGAPQTLIAAGTAATNGTGATLCLEANFTPDFETSLLQGSYTIPLTLLLTAP